MFDLRLMRIRAFAAGVSATLLASIARGGLQFMLIIWLQGIWLPLHGYNFKDTPLWSGIYLLALTFGFVFSGPVSGWLSDKHGARAFASGGLLVSAVAFVGLLFIPINFSYPEFAALIFVAGAGMGLFSAPNAAAIMNSVPAQAARRRLRHAGHVPELRLRAVHRHLLLADDRGPGRHAAHHADQWPHRPGRARTRSRTRSARCRRSAACSPRSSATTRSSNCSRPTGVLAKLPPAQRGRADRQELLPAAHLPAVPPRPGHRVHHGR